MKRKLIKSPKIVVKKSKLHGYGVFAEKKIKKGEVIEECYILVSRGGDKKLEDYYFDANGRYALLTGYGVIYNHAEDPNADYHINVKRRLATIKADRDIKKDEEIFLSYGEEWFSSRNKKDKSVAVKKKKKKKKKKAKMR